jgi:hypothetical protein
MDPKASAHIWCIYVTPATVNGRDTLRFDFKPTNRWTQRRAKVTQYKTLDSLPSELIYAIAALRSHGESSKHVELDQEFHLVNPMTSPNPERSIRLYASTFFFEKLMGFFPTQEDANYALDA